MTAPVLVGDHTIWHASIDTQRTGRMGELVVELELLKRGWIVGNFNATTMNSAGWDLFAARGARTVKLRVKAKRAGIVNFRWAAKGNGRVFAGDFDSADDFVAAVSFERDGGHRVFILPTSTVAQALDAEHSAWLGTAKRGGGPRKDTSMRSIYIDDQLDSTPGHGFARKWAAYESAWGSLDPSP